MSSRAHLLDFRNPPSSSVSNVNATENPSPEDNVQLSADVERNMTTIETFLHNPENGQTAYDNSTVDTDYPATIASISDNTVSSVVDIADDIHVDAVTVIRSPGSADANDIASTVAAESGNYLPRRRELLYRIFAAMRAAASPTSARRQVDGNDDDVDEFLRSSGSSSSSSGFRRHQIFVKKTKKKSSGRNSCSRDDNRRRQSSANDRELSLQQLRRLHRQHQSQFHHPHHHPQLCLDSSYYGNSGISSNAPSLSSPDEAVEAKLFRIIGTAHIVCGVCFMFLHILEAIFVSSRLLFTIWIGFFYILVGVMCIFGYVKWSLALSFVVAASAPPLMYFLSPKEICDDSAAGGGIPSSSFPKNCASLTRAALAHSCVVFVLAELILCVIGVGCAISVLIKRRRRGSAERPSRASRSARTSTASSAYYSATTSTMIDPTATLTATAIRESRRDRNWGRDRSGLGNMDRIETAEVLQP